MIHIACGEPAFLFDREELVPGEVMQALHAAHVDGRPISSGDRMVCDSCRAEILFPGEALYPEP